MYHRIGIPKLSSLVAGQYVAPSLLASQMKYLQRRRWSGATLDQILNTSATGCRFAITFDDGYLSVYQHAFPLLQSLAIPAAVYIVAGEVGGINQWDRVIGDYLEPMMDAKQIRSMHEAGIEIGSHTMTHAHLPLLSDAELKTELHDSKAALEDIIGSPVRSFSYPYGDYDQRVKEAVIEAGYSNALSTRLGVVSETTSRYDIPRVNVRWNSFGFALRRKIARAVRRSFGSN